VIACSLPPLIEMHVSYDDGLKLMIIIIDVDLLYNYDCLLECYRFKLHIFVHV
jgi:hypothetical protein